MAEVRLSTGAVIVPAHDEEGVVLRALAGVAPLVEAGIEVIVAANACTDGTAARARTVPGVRVLEIAEASKPAAMNAADEQALGWPRLYLDADIQITPAAVRAVFATLDDPAVLAARPAFRYADEGCSRAVRAYYRARCRIPAMHQHLWGAGAYALSEAGHGRLGRFPAIVADDLFVDQLFDRSEVAVVDTEPVAVQCPRTLQALVQTLRRVYAGRRQLGQSQPVAAVSGLRAVLGTASSPSAGIDAAVYAAVAVVAKVLARWPSRTWLRDDTSRRREHEDRGGRCGV